MRKIQSLFMRNYDGDRLVRDEIVPGSEWVVEGEGVATVKWDGTCCRVRKRQLQKRHDRKVTKQARKAKPDGPWIPAEFKPAPPGWIAAELVPNLHTGHWPGWIAVGDEPESQWHREAWDDIQGMLPTGSYELIGEKINGNPYQMKTHVFIPHGKKILPHVSTEFITLMAYLDKNTDLEGIVWHHPDGRMVKIKRRDFGLEWPVKDAA